MRTRRGYQNLVKLVSKGYLEGFYYKPRIDKELLREHSEGLIGLSACLNGEVAANVLAGRVEQAEKAAVGVSGHLRQGSILSSKSTITVWKSSERSFPTCCGSRERTGIRAVATNDCHYMHKDDCRAHDILLCIQTGKTVNDPNRMKFYTDQFYFKTRQEMDRVFGEIPHVLDQTVEIAERCSLKLQKVDESVSRNLSCRRDSPSTPTLRKSCATAFRTGCEHLKPLVGSRAS